MTQETIDGTAADQSRALAHHAFVFQSAKALGLGLFFWCGFLAFVIEEPSPLMAVDADASPLMMGWSARAIRRALAAKTSVDAATAGYGQTARAFVVLLGLWWVMELGAVWGLYHEAWAFTFVSRSCADAACGGPWRWRRTRSRHAGAPRWVCSAAAEPLARRGGVSGGHAAAAHPGGAPFRLPEVVAGLLVVNVALWFATYASARSRRVASLCLP